MSRVERRLRHGFVLVLVLASGGCGRGREQGLLRSAEFGVFFGGQVQELKLISKELDPARQRHGFRLTFREPLIRPVPVVWEISLPVPAQGGPRSASVGEMTATPGLGLLDVPLSFRPSDPAGSWHAKVSVDGQPVIDRDFEVIEAGAKASGKAVAR